GRHREGLLPPSATIAGGGVADRGRGGTHRGGRRALRPPSQRRRHPCAPAAAGAPGRLSTASGDGRALIVAVRRRPSPARRLHGGSRDRRTGTPSAYPSAVLPALPGHSRTTA